MATVVKMNRVRRTYYKTEEYSPEELAKMNIQPSKDPAEIITKKLFEKIQIKYEDLMIDVAGDVLGDDFRNIQSLKRHGNIQQQDNGQKWLLINGNHVLTIFPAKIYHDNSDHSIRCSFDYVKIY